MISQNVQRRLIERYSETRALKGLREGFSVVGGLQEAAEIDEQVAHAATVYLDIAGFSHKVTGMSAPNVRDYLDGYYRQAIVGLSRMGGRIDRIAGDGIIAVFSSVFDPSKTPDGIENAALSAATALVGAFYGTEYEAKAAVSVGDLLFCRTGLADIWEELTVIGPALTEVYRIEEQAQANEVVLRGDGCLGARTLNQAREQDRARELRGLRLLGQYWSVTTRTMCLRGVEGGAPIPMVVKSWTP